MALRTSSVCRGWILIVSERGLMCTPRAEVRGQHGRVVEVDQEVEKGDDNQVERVAASKFSPCTMMLS